MTVFGPAEAPFLKIVTRTHGRQKLGVLRPRKKGGDVGEKKKRKKIKGRKKQPQWPGTIGLVRICYKCRQKPASHEPCASDRRTVTLRGKAIQREALPEKPHPGGQEHKNAGRNSAKQDRKQRRIRHETKLHRSGPSGWAKGNVGKHPELKKQKGHAQPGNPL